jgi:CP family cyanate transporter-like MFS transporter
MQPLKKMKQTSSGVVQAVPLLALILLTINLRPALTSVGPLLEDIRASVGMSATAAGVLNSLPLLAFAVFSPLAQFGRRFGIERTLVAIMALLALGILLRSHGSVAALFGGSIVLAAGIAVGNVLMPGLIKRDYPERVQGVTTIYVMALGLSSAVAAGLAVPLSHWLPGGWNTALAAWAIPAMAAALFWLPLAIRSGGEGGRSRVAPAAVWRSALAWQVTFFMGLQSLAFYVIIGWFPAILRDAGYSADAAGFMMTAFQILSLFVALGMSLFLRRAPDQRLMVVVASLTATLPVIGLQLWPGLAYLWIVLLGLGSGGCFILAMTFIGLRSANAYDAASLSMMSQSIGYLLASTGPFIFGLLHDISHGWQVPLAMLPIIGLIQAAVGIGAGRNRTV